MNILVIGKNISKIDSADHINIILPLIELNHDIELMDLIDNKQINESNILESIKKNKTELIFFIPVEDEIEFKFVTELAKKYTTLAYFYDDTWRIEYSKKWARAVSYLVTSDRNWKQNFKDCENKVIFSPFFVNCKKYLNSFSTLKKFDISFVGQYHPYREWVINKLIKDGFNVTVFGHGWSSNSTISFSKMIDVFNDSKINLNLSNCISFDIRYLLDFENKNFFSSLKSLKHIYNYYFKKDMKIYEMVKARFFEINACGGFQLSFYAEGLESAYDIGKDLVVFNNFDELTRRVKYYLENAQERKIIAENGYKKTLLKHEASLRLADILSQIEIK
jgi:spore maturation protein CgeB